MLGLERLGQAILDCWGSLWTARAIGYRLRNGIDQAQVALAVIVQLMVNSEASGVLFTANPLTGLRSESVIDATLGLGEALVSGQVEPDHYVVEPAAGRILSKSLGAKALSIHSAPAGGTQVLEQPRRDVQALPDEQVLSLARLGQKAAGMFGAPQDIEWAWAQGKLYLLPIAPGDRPLPLAGELARRAAQGVLLRRRRAGSARPDDPPGARCHQANLCQRLAPVRRARHLGHPDGHG